MLLQYLIHTNTQGGKIIIILTVQTRILRVGHHKVKKLAKNWKVARNQYCAVLLSPEFLLYPVQKNSDTKPGDLRPIITFQQCLPIQIALLFLSSLSFQPTPAENLTWFLQTDEACQRSENTSDPQSTHQNFYGSDPAPTMPQLRSDSGACTAYLWCIIMTPQAHL